MGGVKVGSYLAVQQRVSQEAGDGSAPKKKSFLEVHGHVSSKFIPRPSSLTSKSHESLTLAIRKNNIKTSRMVEIAQGSIDPEIEKARREKDEEEVGKMMTKNKRQGSDYRKGVGNPTMGKSYLEEGQEGDRHIKDGPDLDFGDSEDEESGNESEGEGEAAFGNWEKEKQERMKEKGKRAREGQESEESSDEGQKATVPESNSGGKEGDATALNMSDNKDSVREEESDEEEETVITHRPSKKGRVLEDDDDEEE